MAVPHSRVRNVQKNVSPSVTSECPVLYVVLSEWKNQARPVQLFEE